MSAIRPGNWRDLSTPNLYLHGFDRRGTNGQSRPEILDSSELLSECRMPPGMAGLNLVKEVLFSHKSDTYAEWSEVTVKLTGSLA
jgi:hypothetical protein